MYRLRCKSGVLRTCFHAGKLEPFRATYVIPVDGWEEQPQVTLQEAARLQSPWNSFTKNRCNCNAGTCNTRKCYCRKTLNAVHIATRVRDAPTSHRIIWQSHKKVHVLWGACTYTCIQHAYTNMLFYPCTIYTVQDVSNTPETNCNCSTRCHSSKNCPCKAAKTSCTTTHNTHASTFQCHKHVQVLWRWMMKKQRQDTNMWTKCGTVSLTTKHKEILEAKHDWLEDSLTSVSCKSSICTWGGFKILSLQRSWPWSHRQMNLYRSSMYSLDLPISMPVSHQLLTYITASMNAWKPTQGRKSQIYCGRSTGALKYAVLMLSGS